MRADGCLSEECPGIPQPSDRIRCLLCSDQSRTGKSCASTALPAGLPGRPGTGLSALKVERADVSQSSPEQQPTVIGVGRCINCIEHVFILMFGIWGLTQEKTAPLRAGQSLKTGNDCPAGASLTCKRTNPEPTPNHLPHWARKFLGNILLPE